jgi:hypothetical protein
MRPNDTHGRIPGGGNICRSRSWPSPDRLLPPSGRGLFHLLSVREGYETIPPHDADPKHPGNMLSGRKVVPRQRGCQDRRDICHPRMVGDAPFHHRVRIEFRSEPRLNLGTGAIGQCEECLAGEAGAAKEHADLRKREPRPVQGDPRGVADDRESAISVATGAMRRQPARTARRARRSRQKARSCAKSWQEIPRVLSCFMPNNHGS